MRSGAKRVDISSSLQVCDQLRTCLLPNSVMEFGLNITGSVGLVGRNWTDVQVCLGLFPVLQGFYSKTVETGMSSACL